MAGNISVFLTGPVLTKKDLDSDKRVIAGKDRKEGDRQMSEVYTIDRLKGVLTPVFKKNKVRKAILFGSYSKGQATAHSDVDLLVDSDLRGLAFFGLMDDVCSVLDCRVDLIDTHDIIPDSRVDREIRNTGVVIYEQ